MLIDFWMPETSEVTFFSHVNDGFRMERRVIGLLHKS